MIVMNIIKLGKSRYEIHTDDKIAFVLYRGDLCKYGIKESVEISDKLYKKIVKEVLYKRAFLRTLYLLERKDYTSFQLRQKLKDGLYPEEAIDYAISKASTYGYVDDINYARRYVEYNIQKKSVRQIKNTLFQRGIKKDIIDQTLLEIDDATIEENEIAIIYKVLAKRHYYDSTKDIKERSKQYNYLASKGFKSEYIKRALELT